MKIEATGREQIGQTAFDFAPPNGNNRDYPFVGSRAHPNDLQALCNYTQRFGYDAVGNLESFNHRARGEGWTRHYDYEETSLIESNKTNNRLTRTRIGDGFNQIENYTHDAHGNMTSMPHLSAMAWDSEDRLHEINLGGGGTAYYVYDSAGQRVRKVIESQNGMRRKERFYLGGFELYREYGPDGQTVSLERESLHVMDDSRRIALVETQTVQNGNEIIFPTPLQRYQLGNHLDSASLELDEFGDLISYEEYHPYGTTSFQAGRSAAEVSLKRYRYTAKERDEESGFNYHGARYYAPWLGRWVSADPAGMVDGTNLYEYVRGNSLRLIDPNGRIAAPALAGGALLIAGGLYVARFWLEIRSKNKEIAREWNAAQNEYNEQVRQIEISGDAYCGEDNQIYVDALQRRTETEDRLNGRVNELNDTIRDAMIITTASGAAGAGRGGGQKGNTGGSTPRGADTKKATALRTETAMTAPASKPTKPQLVPEVPTQQPSPPPINQVSAAAPTSLSPAPKAVGWKPRITSGSQVTEQVIRDAMRDAPLQSQQTGGVSLPLVQQYVDRLLAGEVAPSDQG